jgi:DNA polymerase-3 subunit delta'
MREYFSMLYGNSQARARLGRAVSEDTLAHALLLVGQAGSGKKTLAGELAMALNCEHRHSEGFPLPCHTCNTCKRIADKNYPDIRYLRRARDKATIGVGEVRLLREDMYLSPTESGCKIYVIEEAERLTPQAQNALLTVLEEPPRRVFIILLADSRDKILTTIKSRVQTVSMQRFAPEDMKKYLLSHSSEARSCSLTSEDALDGIIMSSDGRLGEALSALSKKNARSFADRRSTIESIIAALKSSLPYSRLRSAIHELPTDRSEFSEAVESLISALRDITLLKLDRSVPLIFFSSRERALEYGRDMNAKGLIAISEILREALGDASKNVSIPTILTDITVKIKQI